MEEEWPVDETSQTANLLEELANIDTSDNGLYTKSVLFGQEVILLIDSGSSTTLLSKRVFDRIEPSLRPELIATKHRLQGANGKDIMVLGRVRTTLMLGKGCFDVEAIVCDIIPDGILGQDFLLQHASKIDYDETTIYTDRANISCWIGKEISCNVMTVAKVIIPPMTLIRIPVRIENVENMEDLGLFCASLPLVHSKAAVGVEGIIQPRVDGLTVCMMNTSEEEVFIPSEVPIGVCEPYKDNFDCASFHITSTTKVNQGDTEIPEHLIDIFNRSKTELSEEQEAKLQALLIKYQNVFAKSSEDLGQNDSIKHEINTGNATPIRQPLRRLPIGKREVEQQEVRKMLGRGVIEPSSSSWSSPIVLVTKKDGSVRFCVDYRRLNDVTIKDAYPIPRIEDCLDSLTGSKWFSTMDLNSGFWQVALSPKDKHKTAFSTSLGLYQFTVLPFGLANSPATFERLMENTLRGLNWEECLVYMDDIIVPSIDFRQGLDRLEHVLQRLESANLKLKPSKSIFFKKSVKVLGHVVSEEGVTTDPEKIAAVSQWATPRTKKQLRSFLGLCSYYRRFVVNFASIAKPLHKLCEKAQKYIWTDEAQLAFEKLKKALTTTPVLAYPKLGQPFILDTDSSEFATGAVLSQEFDGSERVIAYMSKSLNKHERSYCVTRKELLAVIVALRKFHTYLYGQKVFIRTDNSAVSWMRNLKLPTGQMARWIQELSTHNFEIVHRKGRKHSNADALSRVPCKVCRKYAADPAVIPELEALEECQHANDDSATVRAVTRSQTKMKHIPELLSGWDKDDIRKNQLSDESIGPVINLTDRNLPRPEQKEVSILSPETKIILRQWDRLVMQAGMLYRLWYEDGTDKLQLIVPRKNRQELMSLNHDIPTAAHLGWKATLSRIQKDYYWPGMKTDIQRFCRQCDSCCARKPSKASNKAPLGCRIVGGPMEKVCMDILGPLATSDKGNKYVLVICDEFTKWTEAYALPNQEAVTIARVFVDEFICRFGAPLQVHSDQGRNFESHLFKQVCKLFSIYKTRTTSFRPQANGTVERFNRTLLNMLSMYCNKNQRSWDVYLPQVMMAYRSTEHSTTKFSPNQMIFGHNILVPSKAVIGQPDEDPVDMDVDEYVADLQEKLSEIHTTARQNLKKQAVYRKKYYDVRAKHRCLEMGQPVWMHDPTRRIGVCSKLSNRWNGPYLVEKKLDDLTFLIRTSPSKPPKAVHIDRLLPYRGENLPKWMERFRQTPDV